MYEHVSKALCNMETSSQSHIPANLSGRALGTFWKLPGPATSQTPVSQPIASHFVTFDGKLILDNRCRNTEESRALFPGLKSYGKVVYVFSLFPVFGTLILCTKLLGLTPTNTAHQVFPQTVWGEFFLNTKVSSEVCLNVILGFPNTGNTLTNICWFCTIRRIIK